MPSSADSLVSIVVAAYNAERTLGEALDSALAQSYRPLEVVVVDDGSDDGTAAVAQSYPDVVYVRTPNRGPSAARNTGVERARGELLAFLDADDVLPPDKVAVQAAYLSAHPEHDCVLGRQEVFADGDDPTELARDTVFGDVGGVPLMSMLVRRSAFLATGGFDPALRIAEDRDLLIRMRARGLGMGVVDDVVLRRRLHDANLSRERPAVHPVLASLRAKLAEERLQP